MTLQKDAKQNILSGTSSNDTGRKLFDYYIGIDPDVKENGLALYERKSKKLSSCCVIDFFGLYEYLKQCKSSIYSSVVHIEGGWLVDKSNFHTTEAKGYHSIKESRVAQRIAKNVGSNHEVGKLIVEMCIYLDISFVVRKPIKPIFCDENLFKKVTGWTGKTNADARSAANYCYGY